jgi:hypothetical protein
VDDSNGSGFSPAWTFHYLYPEYGSSSLYLHAILIYGKDYKKSALIFK